MPRPNSSSFSDRDFISGDLLTDFVFNVSILEGRTEDGVFFIPGYTGEQAVGLGSANILLPILRWYYPAAISDTVTVDTTWAASIIPGLTLQAVSRVTLVREQGIIAWHVEIGTDADNRAEEASMVLKR